MLIVADGADFFAIVVSTSQRLRLPEEERTPSASPLCRSPKQLGQLLESWVRSNTEFKERALSNQAEQLFKKEPINWTPPADHHADWAALHPANPQLMTGYKGPSAVTFSYDPWVGDHVVNGPEFVLITLHRFDPAGNGIPRHPNVLQDLKEVCERHRDANEAEFKKLIDNSHEWPPLKLRMQFYTADLWPDRASFSLYQLNDSIAAFLLEIAQTGDLSFVTLECVILSNPGQLERLPETWKETTRIVMCETPADLKYWLRRQVIDWTPGDNDEIKHLTEVRNGFTGTFPTPIRQHIYLEALPKETAAKQQRKLYRHQSPLRPGIGLLGRESYRLETPMGKRFHVYFYSCNWLPFVRDFAASEQRELGTIVNFETFVQDDGQRFPLSECVVRQTAHDEK